MPANLIQKLDWDSSFFKKKIGRVIIDHIDQLQEIKETIRSEKYDLVYLFTEQPMLLKVLGEPINTKVGYRRDLTTMDLPKFPLGLSVFSEKKVNEELLELAYQAGHFSRFKLDAHFSDADFKHLYNQWMKKSLDPTSMIFIYSSKGNIQGMTTLDFKTDFTQIGLIGVDQLSRGKRIGRKLIDACFHHTIKAEMPHLDVYAQAKNIAACRFYEACGFQAFNKNYIYHYWTDENTL